MKRILIVLLFFVSLSITAEEFYYFSDDVTDIRNKVWYYGTNSFNEIDEFLLIFKNQFVKNIIATDNFNKLSDQDWFNFCKPLLDSVCL